MRRIGGVAALVVAPGVQRHTLALVIDLDRARIEEDLDPLSDETAGHRVAVGGQLDVILEISSLSSQMEKNVRLRSGAKILR